jgi:hypothetical protein
MEFSAEELVDKPDSGIEKDDIYLPPVVGKLEVAVGALMLPYRFISPAVFAPAANAG